MEPLLEREISWFKSTFNTVPIDHITIAEALEHIRSGKFGAAVARVRATSVKAERNEVKRTICPAYTFRGRFSKRSINGLIESSGIIDLDLDDADLDAVKNALRGHPNVLAFHDSVSGAHSRGLRVLVPVDPPPKSNEECHQAFDAVCRVFSLEVEADALKDISRLSYTSVDEDLYVNPDAEAVFVEYTAVAVRSVTAETLDKLEEGKKYLQLRHLGGLLRWGGASSEMINTALQALRLGHSDDPGQAEPIESLAQWLGEIEPDINLTTFLANLAKAHFRDESFPNAGREYLAGMGENNIETADSRSRSHKEGKAGNAGAVVPMFGFDRPPPRLWVVDRFMPAGYTTLLAADGGTGKSYLAVLLSICVALGIDFLGLKTVRGRVLYIDFELNEEEMKRRYWSVLSGLETTPHHPELEDYLYYLRPRAPLQKVAAEVRDVIAELEPVLIIVDSLTIASMVDASAQAEITPVMQLLETFGTVLCLDHLSGAGARNVSQARAFGSIFKRNHARSTWNLAKADGGGLMLVPDKNNFAPPGELLTYNMTFADDAVRFSNVSLADESLTGGLEHLSAMNVTFKAILDLTSGSRSICTVDEIAAWRRSEEVPITEKTIRNHLTLLRRARKISLDGGDISPTLKYVLSRNGTHTPTPEHDHPPENAPPF